MALSTELQWLLPRQQRFPLHWRMVGNSGDVKGIKKGTWQRERSHQGVSNVPGCQEQCLQGPPRDHGKTFSRVAGKGDVWTEGGLALKGIPTESAPEMSTEGVFLLTDRWRLCRRKCGV